VTWNVLNDSHDHYITFTQDFFTRTYDFSGHWYASANGYEFQLVSDQSDWKLPDMSSGSCYLANSCFPPLDTVDSGAKWNAEQFHYADPLYDAEQHCWDFTIIGNGTGNVLMRYYVEDPLHNFDPWAVVKGTDTGTLDVYVGMLCDNHGFFTGLKQDWLQEGVRAIWFDPDHFNVESWSYYTQLLAHAEGTTIDQMLFDAHGAVNDFQVGTDSITSSSINNHDYVSALNGIGSVMSSDAQLLIWECDVAGNTDHQIYDYYQYILGNGFPDVNARNMLAKLASYTDSTVFAASDIVSVLVDTETGMPTDNHVTDTNVKGDWTLEYGVNPSGTKVAYTTLVDHVFDRSLWDPDYKDISPYGEPVNHEPTSANGTVAATEDTQYVFSAGNFSFSDVDTGDTLHKIQITQLESAGSLKLNGVDVALNQEIGIADITAGHLTFDPAANANGTGYANFHFKVSDGTVYSTASYTETINVTAATHTPGSLDTTFGGDGMVTTYFEGLNAWIRSMVIQPSDGKIVVAGTAYSTAQSFDSEDFVLARYNIDGSLDMTFAHEGYLRTDFLGWRDTAYSVAIQHDGKIVVAGEAWGVGGNEDFALARYNIDGSLDTSFGHDGKVTTDFSSLTDIAYSVAIQHDGKIVAAGWGNGGFALARYNVDGSLDTTFSGDGKLTIDFGSSAYAYSMAIQADGKIVVAGMSDYNFALARLNIDGSLDITFSGDGLVTTDFGGYDTSLSVAIQTDGKIVLGGYTQQEAAPYWTDLVLERYNIDGSLDTTFSGDGKLTTDFSGRDDIAYSVATQADGKIVVAGFLQDSVGSIDFGLARYNSDGNLDTTFDHDGIVTTDISGGDYAYSMAIEPDGKIVVAGLAGPGSTDEFALARYWA
jgi:uncharacterized delta-60 repeat protein